MATAFQQYAYLATLSLYGLSALVYLLITFYRKDILVSIATGLVGIGLLVHTAGLLALTYQLGRLPFANMYEFVMFFAWGLVLVYFVTHRRTKLHFLGSAVMPVAATLMASASMISASAKPLMPALQSYWLQAHVATAVLAYGAFGVSFGVGVLYLIKDYQQVMVGAPLAVSGPVRGNLPDTQRLDHLLYRVIAFGFLLLTLVLITGAVWAEQVWGTWWSWDPKETWALITWLVYAIFLHGRYTGNWRGRRSAWLAVLGFAAVMFTLFGVTWLLPGMHSYS